MKRFLYKWLPIVFGCHCRSDRSFFFRGQQFPLCARCTGELAGMIIASCTAFFLEPSLYIVILLMIPMVVDGFCQLLTDYESTNIRRFLTGCLFGYGFMHLIIKSTMYAFVMGRNFGKRIFG